MIFFFFLLIFLEAWKTPLGFHSAQKLDDDFTVSPDSSTQFKRRKTLSKTPELINLDDDDINDNDVVITYIKTLPKSKPIVMFSGFVTDDEEILKMVFNYLVLLLLLLLIYLFLFLDIIFTWW